MSDEFINVADITDIEINQSQSVELDGKAVLICHTTKGIFDACRKEISDPSKSGM